MSLSCRIYDRRQDCPLCTCPNEEHFVVNWTFEMKDKSIQWCSSHTHSIQQMQRMCTSKCEEDIFHAELQRGSQASGYSNTQLNHWPLWCLMLILLELMESEVSLCAMFQSCDVHMIASWCSFEASKVFLCTAGQALAPSGQIWGKRVTTANNTAIAWSSSIPKS